MLVLYVGIVSEYNVICIVVGFFDVSYLGKVLVCGLGVVQFVNFVFINDLGCIGFGKV